MTRVIEADEFVEEGQPPEAGTVNTEPSADEMPDTGADQDPGPFPLDALPDVMREMSVGMAEVFQADAALAGMAAMATVSGAVGKAFVVYGAVNERTTHVNLYVVAAAPKSYGKGSVSRIVKPLMDISREMKEAFMADELPGIRAEIGRLEVRRKMLLGALGKPKSSEENAGRDPLEELKDVERELANLEREKKKPSLWVGNTTTEALTDVLARNSETTFAFAPEAGDLIRVLLGKYQKDGHADCDLWLSGYSVESYRSTRVSRGDNELVPCISGLLMCQPFLLRELVSNQEVTERGLSARMLMFISEHAVIPEDDGVFRQLPDGLEPKWDGLIRKVVGWRGPSPRVIQCDKGAREEFRKFHNESVELRNGKYRHMEGELGRWRETAVRIAGLLEVAEAAAAGREPDRITPEIAKRAVRIARWACHSTLAIVRVGHERLQMGRVERLKELVLGAQGAITLRDLAARHGFGNQEVEQLARKHPEIFRIEERKPKTGRPSSVLRLSKPGVNGA